MKTVEEFDKATDFKHLPEGKVKHKHDAAPSKAKAGDHENKAGGFPFHNEPSDGGKDGSHDKAKHYGTTRGGDGKGY